MDMSEFEREFTVETPKPGDLPAIVGYGFPEYQALKALAAGLHDNDQR